MIPTGAEKQRQNKGEKEGAKRKGYKKPNRKGEKAIKKLKHKERRKRVNKKKQNLEN
jgi:hypothetical protein